MQSCDLKEIMGQQDLFTVSAHFSICILHKFCYNK